GAAQLAEDLLAMAAVWFGEVELGDQPFLVDRREPRRFAPDDDAVVGRGEDASLQEGIDRAREGGEVLLLVLADGFERRWNDLNIHRRLALGGDLPAWVSRD